MRGFGHTAWTRTRAVDGTLSAEQVAAITDATAADPLTEARLLHLAERASLRELRDEAARAKAAADPDPVATERRIHERRALRRWHDPDGTEHLHATGTKRDMARIDQAIAPMLEQQFEQACTEARREPYEAYAFDALLALATNDGVTSITDRNGREKMRYLGLLRIDWEALVRGVVEGDETCEIAGLGPISVPTARELLGESILELVVTKGRDVRNVTHLGRGPNTAQKLALLWQQPVCTREGCGRRTRLEIDHREDYARVRCTELGNLEPLCHSDHRLKTLLGWALVDGTGTRPMVPPDDPRHPRYAGRPPPG